MRIQGELFALSLSVGGIGVGAVQTEVCRHSAEVAFHSFFRTPKYSSYVES